MQIDIMRFDGVDTDPVFAEFERALLAMADNMHGRHVMQALQRFGDFRNAVFRCVNDNDKTIVAGCFLERVNVGHAAVDENHFLRCGRRRWHGRCCNIFGEFCGSINCRLARIGLACIRLARI